MACLPLSLKERSDAHGHLDAGASASLGQTEIADGIEHAVLVGRGAVNLLVMMTPTALGGVHVERLIGCLRQELLMML